MQRRPITRELLQATAIAVAWATTYYFLIGNSVISTLVSTLVVWTSAFVAFLLIRRSRNESPND